MALTPPTLSSFAAYKQETFSTSQYASVNMHLQAATDLMEIATGLHADPPPNTPEYRLLKWGIMDMAWYIGNSMEDRDALFSPFSSERIGSYSYSKSVKAVQMGGETGIPFFDMAVGLLAGTDTSDVLGTVSSTSYNVMPGYSWYKDPVIDPYGFGVDG